MNGAEWLLILGSCGFGIASALIPIINAEAYVLAVCATAHQWPATFAMVALVLGTILGKLVLFLGARHRGRLARLMGRHDNAMTAAEASVAELVVHDVATGEMDLAVRLAETGPSVPVRRRVRWLPDWADRARIWIVNWGDRALRTLDHPLQAFPVLMASAVVGVPPLAVTTIAAGLRKTPLGMFIFCVAVGRGARFAIIAVPTLLARF